MYETKYKGQVQKRFSGVEINSKSIDSIYGINNKEWIKVTGSISYINTKHEDHEHITPNILITSVEKSIPLQNLNYK